MDSRLLMVARGGGAYAPPPPPSAGVFELVGSGQNAGWVEIPYPQVVTIGTRTFFGWIDGSNGNVRAAFYDHATDSTSTPVTLHAALGGEGTADNHDNPSFIELDDGRVLAAYCRHAGSAILMRVYDPETDTWATETSLDRGNQHDYPSFFRVGSDIWLLFRNTTSGQNANLCYVISSDEGATWSGSAVSVYNGQSGHTPYWRLWLDAGLIHVVITENTLTNLGHFYIDTSDGSLHESDGTTIVDATPLLYASITPVVTATTVQCWGVTTDGGNPVFIYMLHGSSDNAIRRGVWSGSAWSTEEIVSTTNGQLGINQTGSGCAIDPLDPDRVWYSKKVSGTFELFQAVKSGSWTETQLTSGSSRDQVWAAANPTSDGTVDVMWLDIDYTNDTTFGPGGIMAYGTG